jgi:hypothetical protein
MLLAVLPLAGCATLDEFAVGRLDRLESAPFVQSQADGRYELDAVLCLPVARVVPGDTEFLIVEREPVLAELAAALTRASIESDRPSIDSIRLPEGGAPRLYVGSAEGEHAPPDAADLRMPHEKYPPMVIGLDRPSSAWSTAAIDAMGERDALIVLEVGFRDEPKADRCLFGKKVVLGTHHQRPIRFLSAVDEPVEVLQITGMLIGRDGRVVRAGAEGLLAFDSPFWVQMFGGERVMTPAELRQVLASLRRDDRPGTPLVIDVAVAQLLHHLTHGPPR